MEVEGIPAAPSNPDEIYPLSEGLDLRVQGKKGGNASLLSKHIKNFKAKIETDCHTPLRLAGSQDTDEETEGWNRATGTSPKALPRGLSSALY